MELSELGEKVTAIEKRNQKVEADKAWETSLTRRSLIALSTYLVISLFMFSLGILQPFKNAIIPTLGFILSTLSMSYFKNLWVKYIYKRY